MSQSPIFRINKCRRLGHPATALAVADDDELLPSTQRNAAARDSRTYTVSVLIADRTTLPHLQTARRTHMRH